MNLTHRNPCIIRKDFVKETQRFLITKTPYYINIPGEITAFPRNQGYFSRFLMKIMGVFQQNCRRKYHKEPEFIEFPKENGDLDEVFSEYKSIIDENHEKSERNQDLFDYKEEIPREKEENKEEINKEKDQEREVIEKSDAKIDSFDENKGFSPDNNEILDEIEDFYEEKRPFLGKSKRKVFLDEIIENRRDFKRKMQKNREIAKKYIHENSFYEYPHKKIHGKEPEISILKDQVKPPKKYEFISMNFNDSDDDTQSEQSSKNKEIEKITANIYSKMQESDKFKANKPEIIIEIIKKNEENKQKIIEKSQEFSEEKNEGFSKGKLEEFNQQNSNETLRQLSKKTDDEQNSNETSKQLSKKTDKTPIELSKFLEITVPETRISSENQQKSRKASFENKNFIVKPEEIIKETEIPTKEPEISSSKDTKNPFLIQTNHIMNESLNEYVLKKTGLFPEKPLIETIPHENPMENLQKPSESNLFLSNITSESCENQGIFQENSCIIPFGNTINAINPANIQINPIINPINPIKDQINPINPINNPFMTNNNSNSSLFMSSKAQNEPNLMNSPGFFPPNQMNNTNPNGIFGGLLGNINNSTGDFAAKSSGGIFGSLLENTNIFEFNKGGSNQGNNNDGLFGNQLFSDFANQNNMNNANNASMGFNKSSKKKKQRVHN